MPGTIKTKRWDDPVEADDGFRLLVCRYRPRALTKSKETWTLWKPNLGPSRELHAAIYGKTDEAIPWDQFAARYRAEMETEGEEIEFLAELVGGGKTLTLLCSSSCKEEAHCHRILLKGLIEEALVRAPALSAGV